MNEQLLYIMLDVVTPVAVCAAVGVCWVKMKQPFDTQMVTRLVSNVGVPCLVFSTLVGVELDMNIFFDMALAGFFVDNGISACRVGDIKAGWNANTHEP